MAEAAVKDKDVLDEDDGPDFEVIEDATLSGKDSQVRFEKPGDDDDDDEGRAEGGRVEAKDRDERLNEETPEERHETKRNKRTIRQLARERDKLKIEALERENRELQSRVQGVEERTHSQDLFLVDQKLNEAGEYKRRADYAYDQAAAKQDPAAMTEARRHQETASNAVNQLSQLKQRLGPEPQRRAPTVNPAIAAKATRFIREEAPWYDPKAQDPDSRVMAALDVKLSSEGYDAETDEYWAELKHRAARELPNRFKTQRRARDEDRGMDDDDDRGDDRRRDAPVGRGSDRGRGPRNGAGRVVVRVSPERIKALQDSGEWDDPVARKKAIRDYQKFDEVARASR